MKSPFINTENCRIKLPEYLDAALLLEFYLNNKENFEPWEPKRNPEYYTLEFCQSQICDAIQLFKEKQAVKLIAFNKDNNQVIAICNFSNIVRGCFYACHLGYAINKSHEGKGLMNEIILAGIKYMQSEFNMHRIMANHMPTNIRSEKLGFSKEGYAKDYLKINGKWQDHILNSLILPSN